MFYNILLSLLSFFIVAFGTPTWNPWLGLVAASCGYTFFMRVLLDIPKFSHRFWIATAWFTAVHAMQLSWMPSHPFVYIYAALTILAILAGMQFGILSYWMRSDVIMKFRNIVGLASLWTLMEWSRLYFFSGYTFNAAGMALSSSIYSLQLASIGGIYLLTFWIMLVNLTLLRSWISGFTARYNLLWVAFAAVPYLFGAVHIHHHAAQMAEQSDKISVVLMQPAFPVDIIPRFKDAKSARREVVMKWGVVINSLKQHLGKPIDLIAIPEYFVPYGTYLPIFPLAEVRKAFAAELGPSDYSYFPPLREPYAIPFDAEGGYLLTNAFFAQAISNLFNADVIVGLEDTEEVTPGEKESYSAAFIFTTDNSIPNRYEKRILVPLGEYIPFHFMRNLASTYGIQSSFTCGSEAKIFNAKRPYGISICYEETCGHLMRESRLNGAELLVNLTNDAWFPNSNLPQVHYDHSRLRTVENGIPLVRSCNTGITGAFDSLGGVVGILGDNYEESQTLCDALYVDVPAYHYKTVYSQTGDWLVVSMSLIGFLGMLAWSKSKAK